jgi:hypothetical protein
MEICSANHDKCEEDGSAYGWVFSFLWKKQYYLHKGRQQLQASGCA